MENIDFSLGCFTRQLANHSPVEASLHGDRDHTLLGQTAQLSKLALFYTRKIVFETKLRKATPEQLLDAFGPRKVLAIDDM